MERIKKNITPAINSGSMADIAFLLLIFFLLTTTIVDNKGLFLVLPPDRNQQPATEIKDRNLFVISINSEDKLLVENEYWETVGPLKSRVKNFVLNNQKDIHLSESPEKAIISYKTSRNTSYGTYILVLDEIIGAYNEIYAERVNMSVKEFNSLDPRNPRHSLIIKRAKEGIPRNISIAEPGGIFSGGE
ncbi:MAG: biopolymer transporter ExbD [Cyclobacteriaceae bacterium]|nr:biopolymer transporter ExbD [Cyclobacteriaceae bacterium]